MIVRYPDRAFGEAEQVGSNLAKGGARLGYLRRLSRLQSGRGWCAPWRLGGNLVERVVFSSPPPSNKNKCFLLELSSSRGVLKPNSAQAWLMTERSWAFLSWIGLVCFLCLAEMKLPPEIRFILLPNCWRLAIFQWNSKFSLICQGVPSCWCCSLCSVVLLVGFCLLVLWLS